MKLVNPEPPVPPPSNNVSTYFLDRLTEIGVTHIFAISGDYIDPFIEAALAAKDGKGKSRFTVLFPANEQEAAYAADGFARKSGKPALVATTDGVGTFNTLNAITSCFVEKVPVICFSGVPKTLQYSTEDASGKLFHHMVPGERTLQRDVFNNVTVASYCIKDSPSLACREIDSALCATVTYKQPVFLEFQSDVHALPLTSSEKSPLVYDSYISYTPNVQGAAKNILDRLRKAKNPLIWAGSEIVTAEAQELFKEFITKHNISYVSDIFGKGLIDESTPQFVGIFFGTFSTPERQKFVKDHDFVISLGVIFDDIVLGQALPNALSDSGNVIICRNHFVAAPDNVSYPQVDIKALLQELLKTSCDIGEFSPLMFKMGAATPFGVREPVSNTKVSYDSVASTITKLIKDKTIDKSNTNFVLDASLSLFSSCDIPVAQGGSHCELLWGAIGWSSGAAVGIKEASKGQKTILFIGDGGFMNCSTGLSTMARYSHDTIMILFQNKIYGIDQFLVNPPGFPSGQVAEMNKLYNWDLLSLAKAYKASAVEVHTQDEFLTAFKAALARKDKPSLIVVKNDYENPRDYPACLKSSVQPPPKAVSE